MRGRRAVRRALALALTVLVTWFILDRVGLQWQTLRQLDLSRWRWDPLPLAGSVLLLLTGYVVSGWLWARMVREMGGPRLGAVDAVRIYMVANLGRYVPGKVLQIAGMAWLARDRGVPTGTAVAAAVVGQGTALLGATVVGLGAFFGSAGSWRTAGWLGVGAVALFVAVTSLPRPAAALQRIWLRLARRGTRDTDDANEPLPAVPPGGFGVRWTAWYTLNWGVYAGAFWLLFVGLEGWTPFLRVGPAFAAAYVAGYVALFAPAGAGIREAALVVFLGPVLPREAALALAVAARLWATGTELLPAVVLALGAGRPGTHPDGEAPGSTTIGRGEQG